MKEIYPKEYGMFSISKDNYETEEEFRKAVADAVVVLADNDNQVLFRYDDVGNYTIEYIKPKYGDGKFAMITDEDEWEEDTENLGNTEEDNGASQETYETEHIGYEDTEGPNSYFDD